MDCSRWREMASDYIEESLPPHTMDAMRRHAHGCASCQSDDAALRNLCRELNVLPPVDPPLFFRDNVMAAIERQNTARSPFARGGAWWQTMLPQLGRVAGVTTLAGGAVVVLAWTLLLPGAQKASGTEKAGFPAPAPVAVPLLNVLPGGETDKGAEIAPQLRIARVTTMVPSSGPAFDLALWMENADSGTARFNLLGDKAAYRFHLNGVTSPQTLRVPFSASVNKETVDLRVYWTANAADHTRYLFVPLPPQSKASDTTTDNPTSDADAPKAETPPVPVAAPSERQSFGLPDQLIVETARQIAARYNVPVTLDDVPEATHLSLTARDETALETLTRQLSPLGLQVSSVKGGLLVERASGKSGNADAKPHAKAAPEAAPSVPSPASAR